MASKNPTVAAAEGDIARYYNELVGDVNAATGAQQSGFNTARSTVGSIYDDMTRSLTSQANATASGLGGQLNMLGIGAATDSATQNLRNQLNQSLITAARRRATEMSGLASQGAAYGAAGRETATNVGRESVQVRTDVRTRLEEAIAALEAAKAEAQGQIDLQKLQGEIELAQMRASMRARGGGGGGGGRGSPLDALRAQLLGLEILEKQGELERGPESQWSRRGQGGLNQFLNNPSDWWGGNASSRFRGDVQDVINFATARSAQPEYLGRDPYLFASQRILNEPSDFRRDALRQAIQIYFGKA